MIGQKNLLASMRELVRNDKFPRFSIITGPDGGGKELIASSIIPSLFTGSDVTYTLPDVKVDTIRDMIEKANHITSRTFYVIPNADNMSPAAKNALLKVTEEPPNNAYFIMTLSDINNTLGTIKSRAVQFRLDPYSAQDIGDYYTEKYGAAVDGLIFDICETPGEVDILVASGVTTFSEYVENVIDNIAEVSGANSFKIADKINFKDDASKFDLKLFWKAFMTKCSQRMFDKSGDELMRYANGVKITSQYLQDLRVTGVNKPSTFDMWILAIREDWLNYGD